MVEPLYQEPRRCYQLMQGESRKVGSRQACLQVDLCKLIGYWLNHSVRIAAARSLHLSLQALPHRRRRFTGYRLFKCQQYFFRGGLMLAGLCPGLR